jgi:hypothetical protein
MAFRHKYCKSGSSFESGSKAEHFFEECLEANKFTWKTATKEEEFNHIDFWFKKDLGLWSSVDVKARKKINRKDNEANDSFIWIEFLNVQGKNGWLYGKADFIAFERDGFFILVERQELADLCEKICDIKTVNQHGKNPPLYLGYKRYGRNDLLSLIKIEDITNNLKIITLSIDAYQ